jgi:hypothetical protein
MVPKRITLIEVTCSHDVTRVTFMRANPIEPALPKSHSYPSYGDDTKRLSTERTDLLDKLITKHATMLSFYMFPGWLYTSWVPNQTA